MRVEVIGSATLYQGDCREVIPALGKVDAVIADPPYECEAHAPSRILGSGARRELRMTELDFEPMSEEFRSSLMAHVAAICDGWVLCFCQAEAVFNWRTAMSESGMQWRRAMVWVKPDSSPQLSGDRPAQGYESIATAWAGHGGSRWNGGGKRGVFVYGKHDRGFGHGGRRNEHPTQKPVALMSELVTLFSDPGSTVLDPVMGSGTTGVACTTLGRNFIGIEREPKYFDLACRRIDDAQRQGRLIG